MDLNLGLRLSGRRRTLCLNRLCGILNLLRFLNFLGLLNFLNVLSLLNQESFRNGRRTEFFQRYRVPRRVKMNRRHKSTHQLYTTATRSIQKIFQCWIRQFVRVKTGAFVFYGREETFRRDFQMNTNSKPIIRLISMTDCINERFFECKLNGKNVFLLPFKVLKLKQHTIQNGVSRVRSARNAKIFYPAKTGCNCHTDHH